MWENIFHILQTLTNSMYTEVEFKWTDIEHKVFKYIKRIVDHNNLLDYANFNK